MAIQTVGIGAAPNDNTGDTPRTGIAKLNANFTDTTNAASRLVQTSPTDATAGRVMTVGAFGVGAVTPPLINNLETTSVSGLSHADAGATNSPSTGTIHATARFSGRLASEYALLDFDLLRQQMYFRTKGSGSPDTWQPVYTGANLNPNVFGGVSSGDIIGRAEAVSSSSCRLYLPLSSYTAPLSISVSGTFSLNSSSGAAIDTGISEIVLSNPSSNKVAFISVTSSGMTAGNSYDLRTESSASKITVNF